MKKIFDLFNFKQLSYLLIVLPYLAFNCVAIVQLPFFSASNLWLLFLGLFIFDIIIRLLLNQIGTALTHHLLIPGMVPLELTVELFVSLSNIYITIEYIHNLDSKVKILQKTNSKKYPSKQDFEFTL